jgi:drug/metabolite transporter (DMT)-like permease
MSNLVVQLGFWLLYFATDIYGHVAFKFVSTGQNAGFDLWGLISSFWGITAILSWAASSLLWVTLLAHNRLFIASSVGTVTYALMVLAAALIFKEQISARQVAGILCIAVGILLVTRA